MESKNCTKCKTKQSIKKFGKDKNRRDGRKNVCKSCWAIRSALYRNKNPRGCKNNQLKCLFGITLEQYEQMFLNQKGLCKICNKPSKEIDWRTKKLKALAIDHCHETGKVRGLLCAGCNKAIGLLGDNPELIRLAHLYLVQYSLSSE